VRPAGLAAEFHQLRELAPASGVRTLRQSIERAAREAMHRDDFEPRAVGTIAQESAQIRFR